MRRKLALKPGPVAGPGQPNSAERSSGTTRVAPSAYNEGGKLRKGTREMSFAPIGLADDVYSKYCASRVAVAGSARSAGDVLVNMVCSFGLGGLRPGPLMKLGLASES